MTNYKNTTQNNDKMSYTNTDFILKSIITSIDLIELDEVNVLIDPQTHIYLFYSRVNALYSKSHFYVNNKFKVGTKTVSVDDELKKIKERLYNKQFLTDIRKSNSKPSYNKDGLVSEYNIIAEKTQNVYRHITFEFARLGMFFPITKENKKPGVVR